ncbi:hypothetical protein [Halococcus thailandensis]|uniref:Uncharacterized protein n=1 Tax=Halococcus thailandensis JCM 13552 TaxID=1227457 RepID=M0MYR8_9EURY|nr:hypothetical protein [Halococcus thailandensis]EMA49535.1 hypothetical protein C451_18403 [Halococcus thailandensis JCM 13552]
MRKTLEISDETFDTLNELGGTFDTLDEVLQKLIRDAGHEELLDKDNDEEGDNGNSNTMSAHDRKERFIKSLKEDEQVLNVEKIKRSAWKVKTRKGKKIVWIHYHCDFEFFGGSWEVNHNLEDRGDLIHLFLGPQSEDYYVVPDSDLHSGKFVVYDTKDGGNWKFSTKRGEPKNLEALESEYSSLGLITN